MGERTCHVAERIKRGSKKAESIFFVFYLTPKHTPRSGKGNEWIVEIVILGGWMYLTLVFFFFSSLIFLLGSLPSFLLSLPTSHDAHFPLRLLFFSVKWIPLRFFFSAAP